MMNPPSRPLGLLGRLLVRLEEVTRGIGIGLLVPATITGFVTLPFVAPPKIVQFVQGYHGLIGSIFLPVGLLYVGVHLVQTIDARAALRRARHLLRPRDRGVRLRRLGIGLAILGGTLLAVRAVYDSVVPPDIARPDLIPVARTALLVLAAIALFVLMGVLVVARVQGVGFAGGRWLLLLMAAACAITGLLFTAELRYRIGPVDLIWGLHVLTSLLATVLLIAHVQRSRRATAHRTGSAARTYRWRGPVLALGVPIGGLALVASTAIPILDAGRLPPLEIDSAAIVPVEADLEGGLLESCAVCHQETVGAWQASTHARAADNPLFASMIRTAYAEGRQDVARSCLGCHAPHAPDPRSHDVEEVLASVGFRSGIHCISCHRGRPGDGHGDGSMVVEPLSAGFSFVFEHGGPLGEAYRDSYHSWLLVRPRRGIHRSVWGPRSGEVDRCLPCHVQTLAHPTGGRVTDVLQDQFDSWAGSPAARAGQTCTTCHLPEHRDFTGQRVVDHRLVAASTYVAGIAGGPEARAAVVAHLEGELPLPRKTWIDAERPPAGPLLAVEVEHVEGVLRVRTRNAGRLGHSFPNGPTDLLQVWLAIRAVDSGGRVVLEQGWAGPDGAHRLGHELLDDRGRPVRDHRLWEVARVVDRGHVPASGEHRVDVPLPGRPTGPLEVEAAWKYRRLDPDQVARLTGRPAPEIPIVDVGTFRGRPGPAGPT